MEAILVNLNNSKILTGCAMILMNVGGKYVSYELPKSLDILFELHWLRIVVIFCIIFIGTHDIKISFFLTLLFILVFRILLNEESPVCVIPPKYLDFNKDGIVTKEEVERAKKILYHYNNKIKDKKK